MATIRPDLQSAEFARPEFLTDIIAPPLVRDQSAGTLYYQSVKKDVKAQTGRANAATIGEITENILAAATKTFSCAEIRSRQKMSYTQVKGYADLLHAELAMARIAKRAWYDQIEISTAKAMLGAANHVDLSASDDILGSIEDVAASLQDKAPGKVALVISSRNFTRLKANEGVKDRMKNTGVVLGAGGDPRNVTTEQLAAILGVDKVLVGRNDCWHIAMTAEGLGTEQDFSGNAALVVLPSETVEPVEEIQFARTLFFKWSNDGDFYVCESFHDDKMDTDCVDVKGLVDIQILNPELCVAFKLFA